ncbi:MAG: helix-turn-helix transcriptional regulator [Ilumatobacter sp.]|uniref:helix-turn-helix transcriptional regulator n=1 Tax=Ilumatobacter sp. TaxID=1967498 RepID=UPI00391ABCC3
MNRLERLHALSEAIRRSATRPVSAGALADRFGVTRRTIERDIAALRAAGVPLYAERGRNGGHVSLDTNATAVVALSTSEISALLIAVAAAGPDMPYTDAGTSATERLLDSLGTDTRLAVGDLRQRIRVRQQPAASRRARRTVEEAVRRQVVVNLDYVDAHGTATARSVDPVGFYNGAEGWFLIGWCHLREGGRIFRLDRIRSARLTTRAADRHDVDHTLGWVPDDIAVP